MGDPTAADDHERALLWKGRKSAFAAMGRVPDYYVQDGVVPRTKLPEVLRRIDALSAEYGLRVGNVFHAGDGNLHPLVLYDGAIEGQAMQAQRLAEAILEACIDAGGSLTGEHGSASTRRARCRCSSTPTTSRRCSGCGRPSTRRAVQPGEALPDAAAVRRGAGAVPGAPAGEGRACRVL